MKIKLGRLAAAALIASLLLVAVNGTGARAQGDELGSTQDAFGIGCATATEPKGFVFSYGLFEDAGGTGGIPLTTIFDSIVIAPSSITQTFDLFSSDDPDFAAVASALATGAPAGTGFGYSFELPPGEGCVSRAFGGGLAISVPTGATVDFFRLTIPPFSIVESGPGFFEISPSVAQFTLSAFGSVAGATDSDGDGLSDSD